MDDELNDTNEPKSVSEPQDTQKQSLGNKIKSFARDPFSSATKAGNNFFKGSVNMVARMWKNNLIFKKAVIIGVSIIVFVIIVTVVLEAVAKSSVDKVVERNKRFFFESLISSIR